MTFIPDILIASLQVHYYSEVLPTNSINTVLELTRWSATGNSEWRTCPRSRCGGYSGIRTCDPPDAKHRTYHQATTPHIQLNQRLLKLMLSNLNPSTLNAWNLSKVEVKKQERTFLNEGPVAIFSSKWQAKVPNEQNILFSNLNLVWCISSIQSNQASQMLILISINYHSWTPLWTQ